MLNKDIIFQNDSNNHSNDPKYILYFIASFRSHFIPRRMQAKKKLFRYPLRREACTDHTRFVWRLPKMWPKIRIFFRYLSCLCGWCVEHWTKASADQSKWLLLNKLELLSVRWGLHYSSISNVTLNLCLLEDTKHFLNLWQRKKDIFIGSEQRWMCATDSFVPRAVPSAVKITWPMKQVAWSFDESYRFVSGSRRRMCREKRLMQVGMIWTIENSDLLGLHWRKKHIWKFINEDSRYLH